MFICLLFHRIVNSPTVRLREVSKGFFEGSIKAIKKHSLPVNTLSNLWTGEKMEAVKYISLTFDDGWESDYTIALPFLVEHDMKATFFIVTDLIDRKNYLKESWLREMSNCGMEIGSHTVSHPNLTKLSKKEIYEELYSSKCKLEDMTGNEIVSVAIPYGMYNSLILNIAKEAGYKLIATCCPWINKMDSNEFFRISINTRTTVEDFNRLLSFSYSYLSKLYFSYLLRAFLKRSIGIENYLRFRKWLIKV